MEHLASAYRPSEVHYDLNSFELGRNLLVMIENHDVVVLADRFDHFIAEHLRHTCKRQKHDIQTCHLGRSLQPL